MIVKGIFSECIFWLNAFFLVCAMSYPLLRIYDECIFLAAAVNYIWNSKWTPQFIDIMISQCFVSYVLCLMVPTQMWSITDLNLTQNASYHANGTLLHTLSLNIQKDRQHFNASLLSFWTAGQNQERSLIWKDSENQLFSMTTFMC